MLNFSSLPHDCVSQIITYLPLKDFYHTLISSKTLYNLCMNNENVNWEIIFKETGFHCNSPDRFLKKEYFLPINLYLRWGVKIQSKISNLQYRDLFKDFSLFYKIINQEFLLPIDSLGGEDVSIYPFIAIPQINEKKTRLIREEILQNFIKKTKKSFKTNIYKNGFSCFLNEMKENLESRCPIDFRHLKKITYHNLKTFKKFEDDFKKAGITEMYLEHDEIFYKQQLMFGNYFLFGQTNNNVIIGFFWEVTYVVTTGDEFEFSDDEILSYNID